MKKMIIIACIACMAGSMKVAAQPAVKIGNMEILIRKSKGDTITRILLDEPGVARRSEKGDKYVPQPRKTSSFSVGVGFVLPDNSAGKYAVFGINSSYFDAVWYRGYRISRGFSIVRTVQYAFHNYRLTDAAEDPAFASTVTGSSVDPDGIRKQVYRSHHIGVGVHIRRYLFRESGMFLDLGVQGDLAFGKRYKVFYYHHGKEKFRDNSAFNPFIASAVARIGWNNIAFFARYRFTDAFNRSVLAKDLPQWSFGVHLF
ncbi:MAG: hypothetical protein LBR08_13125 [Bacteroidales bacterium]|jgi:hypothetical protein|nr:hypothetical protein [Bacteroidales bacterium]